METCFANGFFLLPADISTDLSFFVLIIFSLLKLHTSKALFVPCRDVSDKSAERRREKESGESSSDT